MDNAMILQQIALLIIVMVGSFSQEIFCLFRNAPNKGTICFLGLISKITIVYFFTAIMTGGFALNN